MFVTEVQFLQEVNEMFWSLMIKIKGEDCLFTENPVALGEASV